METRVTLRYFVSYCSSKTPKETCSEKRLQRMCLCATLRSYYCRPYKPLQAPEIECDAGVASHRYANQ